VASVISINDTITVGDLADKLLIPVTKLIGELMKMGVMVTVNERIDFETAQIIVSELDLDIELKKESTNTTTQAADRPGVKGTKSSLRPPVVAVMGHVDHGKTSLLDAIRGADVAKGEAGGITQHISAYQVEHKKRLITFLDTPGHEAFAALREHGAQLTDLVIIVVAADDGVKPQTIEAIRFARKANVKMLVAVNKIDKPGANINRVKQELAEQDVLTEGWGGDVVVTEVSAKTKEGVDQLLDMVLLVADLEELKAYTDVPGEGLIIESHMEQGRGPVAEALVTGGILRLGDFIVAGDSYARTRNLESTDGKPLKEGSPSTPVIITGFNKLPDFGDHFNVVKNEKEARSQSSELRIKKQQGGDRLDINSTELLRRISHTNEVSEFNIIIKADVQGSLVSASDSLKALNTDEVAIRIIGSGIGPVSENDVNQAQSSGAIIYGFNVTMPKNITLLADRSGVKVRLYKIIYELIDSAKEELSQMLKPVVVETEVGKLTIKGIFNTTKNLVICGGEVTNGKLVVPSLVRVKRGAKVIAKELELVSLKRGPQDVNEVLEGEMCGLSLKTDNKLDLQVDDKIEVFTRETVERTI
jgi:translation initiation factor IF-2